GLTADAGGRIVAAMADPVRLGLANTGLAAFDWRALPASNRGLDLSANRLAGETFRGLAGAGLSRLDVRGISTAALMTLLDSLPDTLTHLDAGGRPMGSASERWDWSARPHPRTAACRHLDLRF